MIGIATYWETFTGVDHPIYLIDIWKDTVKPLGGTHLFYIDEEKLNPTCPDRDIAHKNYPSLKALLKDHSKAKFVFLEAERNIPKKIKFSYLEDFKHPKKNVIYVFGKDSGALPLEDLPLKGNHIVTIKTQKDYSMWALIVAGIVLYDRKVKE